ncbi:MAG: ornithine carbamoyltransferase [Phycisphaerae bacterium]|nr:ornithine carbamoyltransferase [Phycisphaerae bacterium]
MTTPSATPRRPGAATHVLRATDLGAEAIREVLADAAAIKQDPRSASESLRGRSLVMLFEKPSLRTRVSFEIGMSRLGGTAVYLDHREERLGRRESIADYARNLERWCDAIVGRVHEHATLEALAAWSRVPVINALSEKFHPCQALADFMTLIEQGRDPSTLRLAFVGDGNNVCQSLMETAAILGSSFLAVTPPSCRPDPQILAECRSLAARSGGEVACSDSIESIAGVDAVYADAWISMGEPDSAAKRQALEPYRVDARAMEIAGPSALFMHCLPAHRGEEVLDEVIDSPASVVFDQAENRLHAQNALLRRLLSLPPRIEVKMRRRRDLAGSRTASETTRDS